MPPYSFSSQRGLLSSPGFGTSLGAGGLGASGLSRGSGLLVPNVMSVAARKKQEEEEKLSQVLPDEKDIAEFAQEEEEDSSSLLVDVLEFPSKVAGFFSLTGLIEGLVKGDIGEAAEGFARGGPWAFLSDALGITDDFAEKKYFRDIRIAAGGSDVDKGFTNVVLNILGDIALDPTTWLNPFAMSAKAARHAGSVVNPMQRLRRTDLRKALITGDTSHIAQEMILTAQKRQEALAKAINKGDIVYDQRFIRSKESLEASSPWAPGSREAEDKLLAEITPGLIFDAEKGVARQAVSLEEKVRSGISAMVMFKVPLFGEAHKVAGLNSPGISLHTARALDKTAEFLRKMPITGEIMRTFDPSQVSGVTALGRATLRESARVRQEVTNAVILEGHEQVKLVMKNSKVVEHFGPAEHRVVADLLELDAASLDRANIREIFGEVHAFNRQQTRQKLIRENPELKKTLEKANNGDLTAVQELYDAGVPLRDSQLRSIGRDPRPGLEAADPLPSLSETIHEQTKRVGVSPEDLPETERVLTKDSIVTREEVIERAAKERVDRLETIDEQIRAGTYTWDDLSSYTEGMANILRDLNKIENSAGITDAALTGYLPRIISPDQRAITDTLIPQRLKAMGDDVWNVAGAFLQQRTFSELSLNEVNLMMDMIGSRMTGYTPLEVLHQVFWKDKAIAKRLKREAPEVLEFITAETSGAVMKRVSASGAARGKKGMLDVLFDPQMGLVQEITDSRNLAETIRKGTGISGLVPFVRHTALSGARSPELHEVLEDGVSATVNTRVRKAQRLIDKEIESRLGAAKNYDDVITEYDVQVKFDPVKEGTAIDPVEPIAIQQKKKAQRSINGHDESLVALNRVRGRKPKPGQPDQRVRARVSLTPGGTAKFEIDNEKLLPDISTSGARQLTADYRARAKGIDAAELTPEERNWVKDQHTSKPGATGYYHGLQKSYDDTLKKVKAHRNKTLAKQFNRDIDNVIREEIGEVRQLRAEAVSHKAEIQSSLVERVRGLRLKKKEVMGHHRIRRGLGKDARKTLSETAEMSFRGKAQERSIMAAQSHEWGVRAFDDPELLREVMEGKTAQKVYWVDRDVARGVVDFLDTFHKEDPWRHKFAIFDHFTHWWKRTTVLGFPASRTRDIMSNISLLMMGGFRHPSSFSDAWALSHAQRKLAKGELTAEGLDEYFKGRTITVGINSDGTKKTIPAAEFLTQARQTGALDGGYVRDEFQDLALEYAGSLNKKQGAARKLLGTETRVGKLLDTPVLFGEAPTSGWTKAGMGFSVWGDNFTKLAGIIDGTKRGMDVVEAADHVKRFLWSPGSTHLSNAEKHVFRRAIPFYNWTRFVTGLTLDQYFSNPRVFTSLGKARDAIERDVGTKDLPMDLIAGHHIAERLGIPVKMGKDGPKYMMFDGYLPHAEVIHIAEAVLGVTPFTEVEGKRSLKWIGEKLNPIIKEPLEMAMNFNLHFQRDVEFFPGEHGEYMGIPVEKKTLKLINSLRLLKTVNDFNIFNLKDLRIAAGDAVERKPVGAEKTGIGERTVSFWTGARLRDTYAESSIRRNYMKAKMEASRYKGSVRRRLEDERPAKLADMDTLIELYRQKQADVLRLQKAGHQFGFDVQKRKRT